MQERISYSVIAAILFILICILFFRLDNLRDLTYSHDSTLEAKISEIQRDLESRVDEVENRLNE